jgi:hypothetical protein
MVEPWRRRGQRSGNSDLVMHIRRREMAKRRMRSEAQPSSSTPGLRKVAIAVAGFSVLLFGVALLVVPIPGTSVIIFPLGLAILAREFQWAQRLLDWSIAAVRRTWAGVRRAFGRRPGVPTSLPCPLTTPLRAS